MNTIKFQEFSKEHPLHKGTDSETPALATSIFEGENIWHRPYQVSTMKEWEDFVRERRLNTGDSTVYFKGISPERALKDMKGEPGSIYFQYMVFDGPNREHNRCVVFCCKCFIMNSQGQTVDKFTV